MMNDNDNHSIFYHRWVKDGHKKRDNLFTTEHSIMTDQHHLIDVNVQTSYRGEYKLLLLYIQGKQKVIHLVN